MLDVHSGTFAVPAGSGVIGAGIVTSGTIAGVATAGSGKAAVGVTTGETIAGTSAAVLRARQQVQLPQGRYKVQCCQNGQNKPAGVDIINYTLDGLINNLCPSSVSLLSPVPCQ